MVELVKEGVAGEGMCSRSRILEHVDGPYTKKFDLIQSS